MADLAEIWRAARRTRRQPPGAEGEYAVSLRRPSGPPLRLFAKRNLLVYDWGHVAAKCIGLGASTFKVSAVYVEFEAGGTAGAVAVPTYDRAAPATYYAGLTGSRDYVRLALSGTPTLDAHPDSAGLLTSGLTNRVTFSADVADGLTGVHGQSTTNGVAVGVALAASPLFSDPAQDVILSRGYFDQADQVLLAPATTLQVDWAVTFK